MTDKTISQNCIELKVLLNERIITITIRKKNAIQKLNVNTTKKKEENENAPN